jgi:hypothetical protein
VLATSTGEAEHGGLARVLARSCLGDGGLWVGSGEVTAVGNVQRGRGTERGGPCGVFPLLPSRMTWVGAEGAGIDRGGLHQHGYRVETNGDSDAHSSSDFLDFCSPGVRSNAHKKLKFEFFKFFTLGGQHTRQGFQRYFCSEEITCFAKICI